MKLAMMAAIIIFDLVPHPSLKLHRDFFVSLISSLFIQDSDEDLIQANYDHTETTGVVALIVAFLLKFQIFYRI